jgi:serine phosphatase RsbU (regulator of sigma subunit)
MSKVLYTKFILLLTLCMFCYYTIPAQEKFEFSGKLMIDNKTIEGAEVIVFLDGTIAEKTATNKVGSFSVPLLFQKSYVLQFKHVDFPVLKVLVSTKADNLQGVYSKSKFTVFPLSSKTSSVEGPTKADAVTAFQINKNGLFVESSEVFSEKVDENEVKQADNAKNIDELKETLSTEIVQIPENISPELKIKYESVNRKLDSLLNRAYTQYGLIIQTARLKSENIVNHAYFNLPEVLSEKSESSISNDNSLKSELKRMSVNEKTFLENKNIKEIKSKIINYSSKTNKSKKDSIAYLETVVQFKEEMVKSARLQLEIDKLNARTHDDSISLQQRETAIFFAEQEIKEAKDKIQIQQLEIRQKNTMLSFAGSALLFFIILSLVVYKSFRDKKRVNIILEKNNLEIANKNKKIIDSIRYAQTIQQAILPIKSTIDKYFESFIIFQPKDIVSGDFYWFDYFDFDRKSVFAVVDCTGHGVPGAFMSMIGNRLLIEAVKEKGITSPVKILDEIDLALRSALMQEETSNNDGMDICVCTIEYLSDTQCKVDFAGAKRPMFYSDADKGMQYLKGTVRGLGGKRRLREKPLKPFEAHSLVLHKGDMIYMTTDGFFDLQSPNRKKFGKNNFLELLGQNYTKDLEHQKNTIIEALHLHKGSEYQIDDITILGIRL